MINGALLLNKNYNFSFKKSFLRVFYPLIVWSIIGVLVAIYYDYSFNFKMSFFTIIGINIPNGLAKGSYNDYHFWYIYALLSIYLIITPLKKMIVSLSQKDCLYLIVVWIVFQFIMPFLSYYFNIKSSYTPYLFTSFLGFYLLGYYLNNTLVNNTNKTKILLVLLLVIAVAIPWALTWHTNLHSKRLVTFFFENFNIFTLIQAIILFIIAKIIFTKPSKIVSQLAKLSFTAYCCHALVLYIVRKLNITKSIISQTKDISSSLDVIVQFALVVFISYFIAWLISLLPKKISAYFGV